MSLRCNSVSFFFYAQMQLRELFFLICETGIYHDVLIYHSSCENYTSHARDGIAY